MLVLMLCVASVESRKCLNYVSDSFKSSDAYVECTGNKPKCCGTRQNTCEISCSNFDCETDNDCDGLRCCGGECSRDCLPLTTWGLVGVVTVGICIIIALFRTCRWCYRRKFNRPQHNRSTNEQVHEQPPFVVSDFENDSFYTPMAPPAYENVVQNTGLRNDGYPVVYNVGLQTTINNVLGDDPHSNNFELNISIRGSNMFDDDFPPIYNETRDISNNDGGNDMNESLSNNSIWRSDENSQQRVVDGRHDEPPPYRLSEETTPEESPNNLTRELADNTGTDQSIDEDSTLNNRNISFEELQTISSSAGEDEHIGKIDNGTQRTPPYSEINHKQHCQNINQSITTPRISDRSSQDDDAVSETTTTHF